MLADHNLPKFDKYVKIDKNESNLTQIGPSPARSAPWPAPTWLKFGPTGTVSSAGRAQILRAPVNLTGTGQIGWKLRKVWLNLAK